MRGNGSTVLLTLILIGMSTWALTVPLVRSGGLIEVVILDVETSSDKTIPGNVIHINVTFEATWDVVDFSSFQIDVLANNSVIDWEMIIVLDSGQQTLSIDFTWDTSGFEVGSYLVSLWIWAGTETYYENGYVQILQAIVVPDDFSTIQAAINAAGEADTIFVRNGTYFETLNINKSISLIGENRENTTINGLVEVISTDNVSIAAFTLRNNRVYIENSVNCSVKNNYFVDVPDYGIYATGADSCWIQGNKWFGIYVDGIRLRDSDNCTVIRNQITANIDQYALWLHGSNGCRVYDNWFANCEMGFVIEQSTGCVASGNLIENCSHWGIDIGWWVGAVFVNNTIRSHYCGVHAEGWSPPSPEHPKWSLYHNNILNCTYNGRNTWGEGNWSGSCEGNYWDDYNGGDSDGDGIGDTPYAIFGGNDTDPFPLMNLYWSPSDINHDLDVDIFDVVRVAKAYLSTPIDPNWNCHCDIAEPFGVIDEFDVMLIADHYGEEYHGP